MIKTKTRSKGSRSEDQKRKNEEKSNVAETRVQKRTKKSNEGHNRNEKDKGLKQHNIREISNLMFKLYLLVYGKPKWKRMRAQKVKRENKAVSELQIRVLRVEQ